MSAKASVKTIAADADGRLFRWVAALTGSKNALKGAGFFLGGALLELVGWRQHACWLSDWRWCPLVSRCLWAWSTLPIPCWWSD